MLFLSVSVTLNKRVQPVNVTLPAFAAECRRPQLSIDISCPQGAQQQTRRLPLLLINTNGKLTSVRRELEQVLRPLDTK